jgi:hypothetical protein
MAPPLSARERTRRAGAVRTAMASRGAGWGVAAGLAGVIVGFVVGHATAPSTTVVAATGTVTPVPSRQVAGLPGPAGGLPAGKAVALPGGKSVVFSGGSVPLPAKILSPYAAPQCGPAMIPGVHAQLIGPGKRLQVIAPGAAGQILIGPGGICRIFIGPTGQRTIVLHGLAKSPRRAVMRISMLPRPAINWLGAPGGGPFSWVGAGGGPYSWVGANGAGPGCAFGAGPMFFAPPGAPLPPARVIIVPGKRP